MSTDTGPASSRGGALLVSDSESVRNEVASVLGGIEGLVVHQATSGQEVRPLVADKELSLVVLDMQIGNMGGVAACMDLRLEESGGRIAHVPVLMLLDRRADVFLARRSGAEGWVIKPLDPIRLRRAVNALRSGSTYHDPSYQAVPVVVGA